MKIIFGLFLCLSAVFSTFAQAAKSTGDLKLQIKTFKDRGSYKIEYKKSEDSTEIFVSMPHLIYGKKVVDGNIFFSPSFRFTGRELKENIETFELRFGSGGSRPRFTNNRSLIMLIDGVKVNYGDGFRENTQVSTGPSDMGAERGTTGYVHRDLIDLERLTFTLKREQLEQISNGGRVEFLLGDFPAVLPDNTKQMLKNILLLSQKK